MGNEMETLGASVLTVAKELISLLAKTEGYPATRPQTKEKKDQTDDIGSVAELNGDLCHARLLALVARCFKRLKFLRHFRFFKAEQVLFVSKALWGTLAFVLVVASRVLVSYGLNRQGVGLPRGTHAALEGISDVNHVWLSHRRQNIVDGVLAL